MFYHQQKSGALSNIHVDTADLKQAMSLYYETSGWDKKTGKPTSGRLGTGYRIDQSDKVIVQIKER